ncbi:MAG: protein kinase domain-containing protein [Gemmatimonadales bacterium]
MKVCPVCAAEYPDEVKFCQQDGTTLRAAAPAADLVGQVVADRYHVVKKLGEGGMGQVYLAEHVKMGRRSAIKVMNPGMVHDPDAVARFNREAANASRITHPNVCAIYDFGETPDGLIYLAMEFIEGEPLTDLLEREGALPPRRAVPIFLQVADALQAAHDLGIVHRDLKPDNIMLRRAKGGGDVVKVVDFGIAKAVGGDESQKVTKTGLVLGTPEFMSPEQLSGDAVDGRSDLYSLALVLFRALTGRLPFEASTMQETMVKRLTDEPQKLGQVRPDLVFPAGLQEILDAALTRSPVDRYQTVAKFAGDVAAVTGIGGGRSLAAAIPATRADSESKTQLLDTAATHLLGAKRAATVKKRSLVPVVVGAIVLLGGGAGAVLLSGGAKPDSTAAPTAPPADSASGRAPNTRSSTSQPPSRTATVSRPNVNLARAFAALDELMLERLDSTTADMVRDSATVLYNANGINLRDQAYAAFVVGNALFNKKDRLRGCDWVRRASTIDPSNQAYAQLLQTQC